MSRLLTPGVAASTSSSGLDLALWEPSHELKARRWLRPPIFLSSSLWHLFPSITPVGCDVMLHLLAQEGGAVSEASMWPSAQPCPHRPAGQSPFITWNPGPSRTRVSSHPGSLQCSGTTFSQSPRISGHRPLWGQNYIHFLLLGYLASW